MNSVHLHLLLNHFPVIGLLFTAALLIIAMVLKNAQFQRVALGFLVLCALVAIPVFLTGEPAEETVEHLAGVSGEAIERHEDIAKYAFALMEVIGGLSLLGLLWTRRSEYLPRPLLTGLLALTIIGCGLFAWTAWIGGQIRHPEINSGAQPPSTGSIGSRTQNGDIGARVGER
jgi:uncharacterized membrane protein